MAAEICATRLARCYRYNVHTRGGGRHTLLTMTRPRTSHLAVLALFFFAATANALHFYLDANEKRCFLEEIPSDTVVEGAPRPPGCFRCNGCAQSVIQVTIRPSSGRTASRNTSRMRTWESLSK